MTVDATIFNGANVTLKAANSVKLLPGFSTSNLSAQNCNADDVRLHIGIEDVNCLDVPTVYYRPAGNNSNTSNADEGRKVIVSDESEQNSSNQELNNISIYPNPSNTGQFNIYFGKQNSDRSLQVTNSFGQLVYSSNKIESNHVIDLKGQTKGVYIVKISSGENVEFRKVMYN